MKYIIFILILCFVGCASYNKTANKCRAECAAKQENNIGARFFWRDWDRTLGKCTCVSKDGSTEEFYMKVAK